MTPTRDAGKEPGEIVVECEIEASPEALWRALTVEEFATDWLGARPMAEEQDGPSYRILEAEPYSRVCYGWHDPATPDAPPVVTVELEPLAGGSTLFRLTHAHTTAARSRMEAANTNRPPLARAA